jgi:hypothetical protein
LHKMQQPFWLCGKRKKQHYKSTHNEKGLSQLNAAADLL